MKTLTFSNSSHYRTIENNLQTVYKLQEYFENTKSTGFYNAFQKEECYFDYTGEYIAIVGSSYSWIYKNYRRAERLANKIRSKIKLDDKVHVFVGDWVFEF